MTIIKLEGGDWRIGYEGGSWCIFDPNGQGRVRCRDSETLAVHLAMVLSENDRLRRELAEADTFMQREMKLAGIAMNAKEEVIVCLRAHLAEAHEQIREHLEDDDGK